MGGRQVKRGRVPSTAVVIPINLVTLVLSIAPSGEGRRDRSV